MFSHDTQQYCRYVTAVGLMAAALVAVAPEARAQSCSTSAQCPDTNPICNVLTHQCGSCLTPVECLLRNAAEPWCSSGDCVGCRDNADCGGLTPNCDSLLHACVPGVCVGLSLLEHGIVDVSVAITGVTRIYACVDGYTLVGTSSTTCQGNGLWSNPPPECVAIEGYCETDLDCPGQWCDTTSNSCTAKVANGGAMPVDASHVGVTLDGVCNANAALLVCASGACDASDNRCGVANGHGTCSIVTAGVCRSGVCGLDFACGYPNGAGPCDASNAEAVCRSGECSEHGAVCVPTGGCGSDDDCGASQWCDSMTFTCVSQVPNGDPLPTLPGHIPELDGVCIELVAQAICVGNVCSASDDRCGYPDGEGPCTELTAGIVCRSGHCDSNTNLCSAAPSCTDDDDCTATEYCSADLGACRPKVPNGAPIPYEPDHLPPVDGTCTETNAAIVCASGECGADGKCGLPNGEGPCTVLDPLVCRSSSCSATGDVCKPAGGCVLDADCAASEWCSTLTFSCVDKLPNGELIPTIPGHVPTLVGLCVLGLGDAICQSGVCDDDDNRCGYLPGNGTCTELNAGDVCRSGVCVEGVCGAPPECTMNDDCVAQDAFCDIGAGVCIHKLPNGTPLPSVLGLDLCNDLVGLLVCESGVCDTIDNKCGYHTGRGPCDANNGATVCRSEICADDLGVCVECNTDDQCSGGSGVCDPMDHVCVQCTVLSSAACAGSTPMCDVDSDSCVPCDGDFGSRTEHACLDDAFPRCDVSGACVVDEIPSPPPTDDPVPTPPVDDEPVVEDPTSDPEPVSPGQTLDGFIAAGSGCSATGGDSGLAALVLLSLLAARRAGQRWKMGNRPSVM